MEESKIISSISILLYSRIYDSLFCQIYDNETKTILCKSVLTGSFNTQLKISKYQDCIHFMVRKSQKDVTILNEFKLNLSEDKKTTIVQKQSEYLKIKKNFSNYSLMIQVFFEGFQRYSGRQFSQQLIQSKNHIQEQQQALKTQLQIKFMAGIHLSNIIKKVYQKTFDYQRIDSSKLSNSSGQSLRSQKKVKTVYCNKYNLLTNNLKKNNYFINCSKLEEKIVNTTSKSSLKNRKFNKSNKFLLFIGLTDLIDGSQFGRRKEKKTTFINIQKSSKQITEQVGINKKIQLFQQEQVINQQFKNANLLLKTNKKIKYQSQTQKKNKKQFSSEFDQEPLKKQKKVQFQIQFNLKNLKSLCQQKQIQKINFKRVKRNAGNNKLFDQKISLNKQNTFKSDQEYKQTKLAHQLSSKFNKSFSRMRYFYENLEKKTIKTIQRQNSIVNYVKRYCLTQLNQKQNDIITQKLKCS